MRAAPLSPDLAATSLFQASDNKSHYRQGYPIRSLIPVRDPIERVVLVAAPRKGSPDAAHVEHHLEDLARLVDKAAAEAVGRISQPIASPTPATLTGEAKVEEVAEQV